MHSQASPTITSAATREFIHPIEDRPLTLREAARLQGFPDTFQFLGNRGSQSVQIGNAVPPPSANILAGMILNAEGKAGSDLGNGAARVSSGILSFRLTDASGQSPALQRTTALLAALPRSEQRGDSYQ